MSTKKFKPEVEKTEEVNTEIYKKMTDQELINTIKSHIKAIKKKYKEMQYKIYPPL